MVEQNFWGMALCRVLLYNLGAAWYRWKALSILSRMVPMPKNLEVQLIIRVLGQRSRVFRSKKCRKNEKLRFFLIFIFKTYIKPYFFLCYSIVSSFFLSYHTLFSFKNSKLQIIKTFKKKTCGAQTYKFFFSIEITCKLGIFLPKKNFEKKKKK